MKIKEKLINFYAERGYDLSEIENKMIRDEKLNYLTKNKTRDGRKVWWYLDESTEYCVDEAGHELDEEEILAQLC